MANLPIIGIIVVVEMILLTAGFILSMTVLTLMTIVKVEFNGWCPLYGRTENNTYYMKRGDTCGYIIGLCCGFGVAAAIIVIYRIMILFQKKQFASFTYRTNISLVGYGIECALWLVAACFITVGFNQMCSELYKLHGLPCRDYERWHSWRNINPVNFYEYLTAEKYAVWGVFVICVLMTANAIFHAVYIRRTNKRDENLVNAMETAESVSPDNFLPSVQQK